MTIENTVEKLLKQREEQAKKEEFTKEELENIKKCAQFIFSSSEGITVARAMMRMSGIYKLKKDMNNLMQIGFERGLEHFYLFFIKGLLDYKTISDIERKQ